MYCDVNLEYSQNLKVLAVLEADAATTCATIKEFSSVECTVKIFEFQNPVIDIFIHFPG